MKNLSDKKYVGVLNKSQKVWNRENMQSFRPEHFTAKIFATNIFGAFKKFK